MTIYMIPSILAFIFNCAALIYTSKNSNCSKPFYAMMLVFAPHHCFETILLLDNVKGLQTPYLMKAYYIMTVFSLTTIMAYSLHVSQLKRSLLNNLIIITSILLAILILFTDKVIAGNQSIVYSTTAIKGSLYPLFQIYSVLGLFAIIATLIRGYRKAESHLIQIRCAYILFAFSPLIICALMILILMSAGVMVNATSILPITISIFLFIVIKGESAHKLTDLRRYMPFSPERQTSQEIMEIYSSYTQDKISYRDCMIEIERLLVMSKYSKSGNNASATAKSMGMPRSSLYSLFNRLKIDIKDQ